MTATHRLTCRCGNVQGSVARPERATRAVCYCKDCQSFARFLGSPPGMMDAMGGTEIVAVRPGDLSFTLGAEQLRCMSLSPKGLLRWYTACCGTPIGNTPRDIKLSHVGLVHTALEGHGQDLTRSFGPVRMRVNRQSAQGKPPAAPAAAFAWALVRYMAALGWSRVSGRYKINPFFDAARGAPRAQPQVLSRSERAALRDGGTEVAP